jgi:allophanate hydrolase
MLSAMFPIFWETQVGEWFDDGDVSLRLSSSQSGLHSRVSFRAKEDIACEYPLSSPKFINTGRALTETIASLRAAYRAGTTTPEETVKRFYARLRTHDDPAVFISLRDETEAITEATALGAAGAEERPLSGILVAVKDNIDVKGLPTTAACPAFAYAPKEDASAVAKLRRAGAIIVGKTNLDQFATGLVGVRSPYGVPRNPFNPALIPGGSSSGSAVAVAAGLVPLALGTDTAGSGRVPAGLNNIVGLKPSCGLISTAGVVPACRSLDCVSIFALTVDDAFEALRAMAGQDTRDPFSRNLPAGALSDLPPALRIAVPRGADRFFFGDKRAEAAFDAAIKSLSALGARVVELDFGPLLEAAKLLYEGPWVAERYAAVGEFIAEHREETDPVVRDIILGGNKPSALDAFRAFYRLAELRAQSQRLLAGIDALMVPTVTAAFTVAEIQQEPVKRNSQLGTYTNFGNLLDLAGLAVPSSFAVDGTPFGVTFLAPAGQDAYLASIGRAFHARSGLTLGALATMPPPLVAVGAAIAKDEIAIAVAGAHLSGMPLNGELKAQGARFLERTRTAPDYRMYLLDGGARKPGLLQVSLRQGFAVELELWALSAEAFGRFVASVPAPLSIGTLALEDGRSVKGFLVEAEAAVRARDISEFGGWREFVARERVKA